MIWKFAAPEKFWGERQSGDLRSVGFAMYQKMVKQAARDISDSGGYADITVLVEAGAPALLPAEYITSPNERLRYYRRLADGDSEEILIDVQLELEDRFGAFPPPAQFADSLSPFALGRRRRRCGKSAIVPR